MKYIIIILFCLIFRLNATSQTDSLRLPEFQMTGTIIGQFVQPTLCGYVPFGTVIEFVISDLKGLAYTKSKIGIIIPCPESYGKDFFLTGKKYSIVFVGTNQEKCMLLNSELLKENNLSFNPYAISIKRVL